MKFKTIIFPLFLSLSSTSCTYFPQNVTLKPFVSNSKSDFGNGKKVNVAASDIRQNKVLIGRRGNGLTEFAAIENNQDLEKLVKSNVEEILKNKGFVNSDDSKKLLKVSLLNLKYKSLYGFFTIGSRVDSDIKIEVENKVNKEILYKNTYASSLEKRHFIAPLAGVNEENINLAFQESLIKIATDEDLMKVLKD